MNIQKAEATYWAFTYKGMRAIDPATALGDKLRTRLDGRIPQPDPDRIHTMALGSILVASEASCALPAEAIGLSAKEVRNYKVSVGVRPYYVAKQALLGIKDRFRNGRKFEPVVPF